MFARSMCFNLFSFRGPALVEFIPFKHVGYSCLSPMRVVWETLMNETLWSENDKEGGARTYRTLADVKMIKEEERCKVA